MQLSAEVVEFFQSYRDGDLSMIPLKSCYDNLSKNVTIIGPGLIDLGLNAIGNCLRLNYKQELCGALFSF